MFNICKASAGSGKTYKLTGFYLKMLFEQDSFSTERYKSILAVTFTNKATSEMKQRILKELFRLSQGESGYMEELLELDSVRKRYPFRESAVEFVKKHSARLLRTILNDYSLFNVSTIDRFLQQIMRAFAREIGHYTSYDISLDTDIILSYSIDQLLDDLENNKTLLKALVELSLDSVEKGESWNIVPKVMNLAKELFSERYKVAAEGFEHELFDKTKISAYIKSLRRVISERTDEVRRAGERALAIMESVGLEPSDFSGGSRSFANTFIRMSHGVTDAPSATFVSKMEADDVAQWFSRGASLAKIFSASSRFEEMKMCGKVLIDPEARRRYANAVEIERSISVLYILGDVRKAVEKYTHDNNTVLLSETTDFLLKVIEGSDTPFIYEKIGGRIDNYLLDEFQDTSLLQWKSLKPLVEESLDGGNDSLAVGDVKQSIYRWRGSDWRLMKEGIAKEFSMIKEEMLDCNWRSARNVVEFNNRFFRFATEDAHRLIREIYEDVEQRIPEKGDKIEGYVRISFVEYENTPLENEEVLSRLVYHVKNALEAGYRENQIAVLVRTNAEGEKVADYLSLSGYKIVTDDSLKIARSTAVRRVVNTLRYIDNPDNKMARYLGGGELVKVEEKSLYDICEEIISSLSENERRDIPFLEAFMDTVLDFVSSEGSDVGAFLKWWDDSSDHLYINVPEGESSIRIMTIHKSKGLEFKVVILPYFIGSFTMRNPDSFLWLSTSKMEEPFNMLPVVPLSVRKGLEATDFADSYDKEALYSRIDLYNVWYVAFTRAVEQLYVIAPLKRDSREGSLAALLNRFCKDPGSRMIKVGEEGEEYRVGEPFMPERPVVEEVMEKRDLAASIYKREKISERLKISFSGSEFFTSERDKSRIRGIALHQILSNVEVESDLPKAIDMAVADGIISFAEKESVGRRLRDMISSVSSHHWFDGTYFLYNERTIMTREGDNYRPDRVMVLGKKAIVVDYKFGTKRSNMYKKQVKGYVSLLNEMGYNEVKGYLWYKEGIELI